MKSIKLLSIITLISFSALIIILNFTPYAAPDSSLQIYYEKNLRGQLFSAFISLSGFVFALKTFIIITMKKELYDHKNYLKIYKANKETDPKLKLYAPLANFQILLSWTVVASLATAISQLTLGLIPHWIPVLICISLACYSLALFTTSLAQMWLNLRDLLDFWQDETDKPERNQ